MQPMAGRVGAFVKGEPGWQIRQAFACFHHRMGPGALGHAGGMSSWPRDFAPAHGAPAAHGSGARLTRRAWIGQGAGRLGGLAAWWGAGAASASDARAATGLPTVDSNWWRATGLPARSLGLYARRLGLLHAEGSPVLLAHNAEQPFALASTAKVVTSLAAIDLLGEGFRWRTFAFLDGPLVDGRLLGDLWIVGGGDARLRATDLSAWMAQWQSQGLREIQGDIVLDRFAFQLQDGDHEGTPSPAADRPHHAWPSAFTIDEGQVQVRIRPGAQGEARVGIDPPLRGLPIRTDFEANSGQCEPVASWRPAQARHGDGKRGRPQGHLLLHGPWQAACGPVNLTVGLPHEEHTARMVSALWRGAGGRLRGQVRAASGAPRATLLPQGGDGQALQPFAVLNSPRLAELLRDINKHSDNLAARHLMLSLVPGFPARAATLDAARRRLRQWLATQGLGPQDLQIDNGSGLSRAERAKPRALVQLLARAWQQDQASLLMQSLPTAGVDGTLAGRMRGGAASGHAFLKTGTLLDARALAGFVQTRQGHWLAVAALVNHPEADRAVPALDRLIEALARHG